MVSGNRAWINGVEASCISVSDRGLAYGDGVFETIRVSAGQPVWMDLHMERLQRSALRLGITPDMSVVREELLACLASIHQRSGVIKLIVTRGAGGRGYNPAGCTAATRILTLHECPDYHGIPDQGITLHVCQTRLGQTVLAGIKHLNRLENVLARAEWQAGLATPANCLEGIMLDFNDRLIEGTMSNLFFVQNGTLNTPALHRCGVEGIARAVILGQAERWGFSVNMGDFTFSDVSCADEVFVCNSVNGVWPVTALDRASLKHLNPLGHTGDDFLWQMGSITQEIRDRLMDMPNG